MIFSKIVNGVSWLAVVPHVQSQNSKKMARPPPYSAIYFVIFFSALSLGALVMRSHNSPAMGNVFIPRGAVLDAVAKEPTKIQHAQVLKKLSAHFRRFDSEMSMLDVYLADIAIQVCDFLLTFVPFFLNS